MAQLKSLCLFVCLATLQLFTACLDEQAPDRASMLVGPEELEGLERALSDTYFCNFSMFQSVPDSWACLLYTSDAADE